MGEKKPWRRLNTLIEEGCEADIEMTKYTLKLRYFLKTFLIITASNIIQSHYAYVR